MKYLCLVYITPGVLDGLPPAERAQLDRDSRAYDEKLMAEGRFLAASALRPVSAARTIRVRGGRKSWIDGPFAETKEVLIGFIFIEAADQAAAEEIAAGIPMSRYGTIELRPEFEF
jgi:hypothetical protein